MPRLADFARNSATVRVPFGDLTVTVRYSPDRLKPADEDAVREAQRDQYASGVLISFLCAVVEEWDLMDDDGRPIPLTPEALQHVPLTIMDRIAGAIFQDMRPHPTNSVTSVGT